MSEAEEDPKRKREEKEALWGCSGCLTLIVGVLVMVTFCDSPESEPRAVSTPTSAPVPEPELEPERQNPLYLANLLCRRLVEDAAQYRVRWTDGFLGRKFTVVTETPESVDFFGDAVELENGFGAWAQFRYLCTVYPYEGTAELTRIEPGRWP